MTQTDQILEHLKQGHSISPLEALELFGCFRLASRISELRSIGYDIKTEFEKNGGKKWGRYWLNRSKSTQQTPLETPLKTEPTGQVCFV